MFTEKFGTYQCTLAVRETFMQKTQREINDAIIDEVLITGTANIAPAYLKIIKIVAAEYVRNIFRRLREHGYDENTMTLYVTGGGGFLIKNFSKVNADRVKFVEDICAAAKGYEYLAETQMKSEAKGLANIESMCGLIWTSQKRRKPHSIYRCWINPATLLW